MENNSQHPNPGGRHSTYTVMLDGGATLKYAQLLLVEGGFSADQAELLLCRTSSYTSAPAYLSQKEVAEQLSRSTRYIRSLAAGGQLVPVLREGSRPFYRRSDVDAYLKKLEGQRSQQLLQNGRDIVGRAS